MSARLVARIELYECDQRRGLISNAFLFNMPARVVALIEVGEGDHRGELIPKTVLFNKSTLWWLSSNWVKAVTVAS